MMKLSCCVIYSKGDDLVSWRKSLPLENIQVVALETKFDPSLQEIKREEIGITDSLIGLSITFPNQEEYFDFSLCRNILDEYANGDWILHMDSDERLFTPHDEFWSFLEAVDHSGADAAFVSIAGITRETKTTEMWESRYNLPNLRLHRRSTGLKWSGICHELLDIDLGGITTADTEILLHHKGYAIGEEDFQKKLTRNAKLLVREYMRERSERNWMYLVKTFSLIKK
jgi:hypothetical protein